MKYFRGKKRSGPRVEMLDGKLRLALPETRCTAAKAASADTAAKITEPIKLPPALRLRMQFGGAAAPRAETPNGGTCTKPVDSISEQETVFIQNG